MYKTLEDVISVLKERYSEIFDQAINQETINKFSVVFENISLEEDKIKFLNKARASFEARIKPITLRKNIMWILKNFIKPLNLLLPPRDNHLA